MAIPTQQEILLPLLSEIGDGVEHHVNDVVASLIKHFELSEEERNQQYPSGNDNVFRNRARFARAFLIKYGLINPTRRGYVKISRTGIEALKRNPSKFNTNFLNQLLGIPAHKKKQKNEEKIDIKNPSDLLEQAYQSIQRNLVQDLLEVIKQCSSYFFEKLVIELLIKMGYGGFANGAGRIVGQSGDGGVDGIIKEDKLGLDVIYIQAKKWENAVGEPVIRDFVGCLVRNNANKGVVITPSRFTNEAKEYVKHIPHRVILIDGELLAKFMIDNNIGVSKITSYDIKKVDSDYFIED